MEINLTNLLVQSFLVISMTMKFYFLKFHFVTYLQIKDTSLKERT